MKILLLGNTGQLGWELERSLQPLGEVSGFDLPEVDLADEPSLRRLVRACQPEWIVNAAAYTAVDAAESEPDLAEAINAAGPQVLAEEAARLDAFLVHFSTDYVFDGRKGSPYTESDEPNPLNVYGVSKLHGEQAIQKTWADHLILRTSWVYSLRMGGFVNKVLHLAHSQEHLRMVSDQVGNPTWCRMLAEMTAALLVRGRDSLRAHAGMYHLAGGGFASRLEWAKSIIELDPNRETQKVRTLSPALTSEFPAPARRPLFSALDCALFQTTFAMLLPDWKNALQRAMQSDI